MGFLTDYYDKLAKEGRLDALLIFGMYDERVYEVVDRHHLANEILNMLPSPRAAVFLSRGMVYNCISEVVIRDFIKICMMLSRYKSVEEGASLAELIGSCGIPEQYRMNMFNFSETYRHMILSRSYFPQRSVLRLLSYIFCDDVLSDAVAQLQYKSDILNHVNKVYVDTPDFVSWRFSVRVMSLAGGYNEDRSDVEYTEALTRVVTRTIPEFFIYFTVTFFYAMFRHYPRRVRGITPRWLARHRALFSAIYGAVLGVYVNSFLEYRIYKHRVLYELRKSQEYRRRRGAARRGIEYPENKYFNNLEGVTRRIYSMQCTAYSVTVGALLLSMLPLTPVKFPKWMGDVAWRHPFVPRLFPTLLGMHTASRCMVPFVFAPFVTLTIARFNGWGATLYDRYVECRMRMWYRKVEVAFDTSTDVADVDITRDSHQKTI
ncbi:hypothetical protein TcYC6_0073430 [Trypanosoma cruzi]|uniref:Uncharacterized protein n=1 Tax=Trypanosoma cruzi (strain CL Brener) TaxID=353153 RepID=Q4E399_TRYCC|nr:hypothetical protein, conserved [Trypanosoma cruzi]EAN99271.1 hypothetical protein, conserved [Trypanosoma cruzi]KAF8299142.1 hypothetical protein TcYC6_0073430 [Trypanosoma cruzi]|eukprot:XP_821122.1 hypothetical protein [Trypanosoma cruzi strain CL Brener]